MAKFPGLVLILVGKDCFGHLAAYMERILTLVSVLVLYFFYLGQSLSVINLPKYFVDCKTHLTYWLKINGESFEICEEFICIT